MTRFRNPTGSRITARVGIGTVEHGGFGLTVALDLDAARIAPNEAVDLMNRAGGLPSSRATRGNIDITLTVDGSAAARGSLITRALMHLVAER